MNWFNLLALSAFICCIVVSIYIYCHIRKDSIYKWFCLAIFSVGFWAFDTFLMNFAQDIKGVLFILHKGLYVGAIVSQFAFINWVRKLRKNITKNENFIINALIFGCIAMLFLNFSNRFIEGVSNEHFYFSRFINPGDLYFTFMLLVIGCSTFGTFLVFKQMRESAGRERTQLLYIIAGSMVMYLAGYIHFSYLYGVRIYPIAPFFVIVSNSIFAYAIVRHRLMDITIVIKKTLAYSILVSIITALYFVIVYALEKTFSVLLGYHSIPLAVVIIAFFSLIFIPLKNKIQRIIDNYFFRGTIDQIDEENIRLREELQKTEKLKAVATLAAGMAHEIKNPLTSIKTFTEYLPKKKANSDFIEKFQTIVGGEIDKINRIVRQLLEFSKPSELQLKEANVNNLLDETLNLLNNDLLKHNIKVEKRYSTLSSVKVDPSQMKQVFLNLLLNAIDSMKSGGVITVTTENTENNQISIKIKDTGTGISKEDLKHVFDPFFSKKDDGTGLGLSVVHGIVEKHGGKITVNSQPENGTEFEIKL